MSVVVMLSGPARYYCVIRTVSAGQALNQCKNYFPNQKHQLKLEEELISTDLTAGDWPGATIGGR